MASTYPATLDSFATNKNNGTVMVDDHHQHHNDLADAVNKIESELGTHPSGVHSTVASRFSLALVGDGSTDDAAIVTTALAAIPSTGGEIVIPCGTWTWKSVPKLPKNLTGWLRIRAEPGALIKLTTSGPRLFDFDRTADFDTFTNLWLEGLTIDVDNISMSSSNHVVLGMQVAGSETSGQRVNVQNLIVRNIRVLNCPVSSTDLRRHIWIISRHLSAGEGTQTYLKDILVEDCELNGGSMGVVVAGTSAGTSCNVLIDNVTVRNVKHNIGSVPSGFWGSSHVHIGSRGFGGSCVVENVWGQGSRDVGVEINGMSHAVVRDCYIEDSHGFYFVHANYNTPTNPGGQQIELLNTHGVWSGGTHATDASSFAAGIVVNSNPLGSLTVRDCSMYKSTGEFANDGTAIKVDGEMKRLLVDGFEYVEDAVNTGAGSVNPTPVYIDSDNLTPLIFRNMRFKIAGTRGGAGTIGCNVFGLYGSYMLDVDTIEFDINITNGSGASNGIRCFNLGQITGSVLGQGTIRRIRCDVTDANNPNGIRVYGTTPFTITRKLLIEDCDFSGFSSGTADLIFHTGDENKDKVVARNNRWLTYPRLNSSITPGTSPYTHQNLDQVTEMISVTGGTVSLIELSENNSTFGTTGLTAGMFLVDPASSLRVTYSSVPTMRKYPVK